MNAADDLGEARRALDAAEWEEALRHLERVDEAGPTAESLELRAQAAYGNGDFEDPQAALDSIRDASADNRYLIQTLDPVRRSLALLGNTTFSAPGRIDSSNAEHEIIVDAIANRDEEAAEEAARKHIIAAYAVRLRLDAAE